MAIEPVEASSGSASTTLSTRWEEYGEQQHRARADAYAPFAPIQQVRRTLWDHLTPADQQLITAVTGQDLVPVMDGRERPISMLGSLIAVDRADGTLADAQLVDEEYLFDLLHRHADRARPEQTADIVRDIKRTIMHLRAAAASTSIDFSA